MQDRKLTMRIRERDETITLMNELGAHGKPFVFAISYDCNSNILEPVEESAQKGILIETPDFRNHTMSGSEPGRFTLDYYPVDPEIYNEAFDAVMGHIHYGNTFLLNLTFPTTIEIRHSLADIFCCSNALFKLLIEDSIVVFSPERFVRIENGVISSNPMKGTIDASVPDAQKLLKSDRKEDAEHNTIVDLIRNDLSMVASDVRVNRFKYIDRIRTNRSELLQMSSEIIGRLPGNYFIRIGDIIFKLLPAGSVTGAPKPKTVEIINKTENYSRGFYTGIFGYFDGTNLDSSVMIRFIEKEGGRTIFKSGGGITHLSKREDEYREMLNKIYVPIY